MRKLILSLLFVFLVAPGLSAAENGLASDPVPEALPTMTVDTELAPSAAAPLSEIAVAERAAAVDANAEQLPARGSFWWIVGVIVVAGVVLAVLT